MNHRERARDKEEILNSPEAKEVYLREIKANLDKILEPKDVMIILNILEKIADKLDEYVSSLLLDPEIMRNYDYDGKVFSSDSKHTTTNFFNGAHTLENASRYASELVRREFRQNTVKEDIEQLIDFYSESLKNVQYHFQVFKREKDFIASDIRELVSEIAKKERKEKKQEDLSKERDDLIVWLEEQMKDFRGTDDN